MIEKFGKFNENKENGKELISLSIKDIYDILAGSSFEEWHDKDFMDHIEGTEDCKSKDVIYEDIKNMFK